MKVIGLTDVHGRADFLVEISDELKEADLVLVSGDITHFGRREDAYSVVQEIKNLNTRVFAVPGNCDYPEASLYLEEAGLNLHRRCVPFEEHILAGIGGSLPCPGKTPNEHSEEEFNRYLEQLKKEIHPLPPLIFVSHQPPVGTICDFASSGFHVGSQSIRDFILEVQPLVCFTGHIHEGVGIDFITNTAVVNPGPLHFKGYTILDIEDKIKSLKLIRGRKIVESL